MPPPVPCCQTSMDDDSLRACGLLSPLSFAPSFFPPSAKKKEKRVQDPIVRNEAGAIPDEDAARTLENCGGDADDDNLNTIYVSPEDLKQVMALKREYDLVRDKLEAKAREADTVTGSLETCRHELLR